MGNLGRIALSISNSAYDWFITRQWGKEFHTPWSRRWWAGIKAHKTSAKEATQYIFIMFTSYLYMTRFDELVLTVAS